MPAFRFLHTADLHLDSPLRSAALRDPEIGRALQGASRTALERIGTLAIEHGVEAVAIAGDLFDDAVADVATLAALAGFCRRLGQAGIAVVAIRGNHDALLDLAGGGALAGNLHVFGEDGAPFPLGEAALHGVGFGARHVTASLLPRYGPPVEGRVNVGLMHTSLAGAEGHDRYAPCGVADLHAHGYDHWALGHVHKREEHWRDGRAAVMPGIPQGRHVGEPGRGSATLTEIDGGGTRLTALPVATIAFGRADAAVDGVADWAGLQGALEAALAGWREDGCRWILRLELGGAAPLRADMEAAPERVAATARAAAEAVGGVDVERVRLGPAAWGAAGGEAGDGPAEELTALMRAAAAEPSFAEEAGRALAALDAALPARLRGTVGRDAEALAEAGIAELGARLRGAGGG